jgi:Rrf2 family cysteine metabolism transcriptional repressor
MMFSTRSEYGVRVLIALGRRRDQGPVPLADIAESESLPLPYLEHLAARLREAELIRSTRGARGGYELARPAEEITMAAAVNALEGTLVPMQCFTEPGEMRVLCNHELDGFEHCATRLLWTRVQGGVVKALEQTTLGDLVEFAEHGLTQRRRPSATKTRAGKASARTRAKTRTIEVGA